MNPFKQKKRWLYFGSFMQTLAQVKARRKRLRQAYLSR